MGVTPEHGAEEGAAGGEDDFVGVDLIIVACEGHVEKVFIIPQFSKSPADVRLKVVPLTVLNSSNFFCPSTKIPKFSPQAQIDLEGVVHHGRG